LTIAPVDIVTTSLPVHNQSWKLTETGCTSPICRKRWKTSNSNAVIKRFMTRSPHFQTVVACVQCLKLNYT